MKDFLKDMVVLLRALEMESPEVYNPELKQRAEEFQRKLESGEAVYNELHSWWVFWRGTSSMSEIRGASISEAFTNAGYGGGAVGAVDFYTLIPRGKAACMRTTWPDNHDDKKVVLQHIVEEMDKFFPTIEHNAAEYDECLDELNYKLIQAQEHFGDRHFITKGLKKAYDRYCKKRPCPNANCKGEA